MIEISVPEFVLLVYMSRRGGGGNLTGTVSWCSRGLNSHICSHSAVQLQSCALTNQPICDPKPEKDTMMKNTQHFNGIAFVMTASLTLAVLQFRHVSPKQDTCLIVQNTCDSVYIMLNS